MHTGDREVRDASIVIEKLDESPRTRKVKRAAECFIEIRPNNLYTHIWWRDASLEEQIEFERKQYEDWAKELREFLRDHRSQDIQDVLVRTVETDACSECGKDWDIIRDGDKVICAYCGVEVEE
jgi:hypothetical protein